LAFIRGTIGAADEPNLKKLKEVSMKTKIIAIIILCCFFLLAGTGSSPAQETTPTEAVRTMLDRVMTVQTDPLLQGKAHRNERRIAIKKIIEQNFYFDGMSRLALGPYWNKIGKTERAEFERIFTDLFQDSYTKLVLDFLKREKIVYGQKEDGAQGNAVVKTRILRMNEEIPVDYSLVKVEGKWLVQDVAIDGVSIIENYRRSFTRVIQRESFKELLRKMQIQQKAIEKSSGKEKAGR